MTSEVRIYVEGGGDQSFTKQLFLSGIRQFFDPLCQLARARKIHWSVIAGGSRQATFGAFQAALQSHPEAFNILLVDAEVTVATSSPWDHLKLRDNWDKPAGIEDKHCHLMIQTMEAWLIADRETLRQFYGKGFHEKALPKTVDLEQVPKDKLAAALEKATQDTKKGKYHKIQHGAKILERLRLTEVRQNMASCERFVTILAAEMGGTL
jgi:hypothetical protein